MAEQTATMAGVERIAAAFEAARVEGRAALMPYMMGGFPDPNGARAVAEAYTDAGADLIELGIPFSDPLADGPVIHAAATSALAGGATLDSALAAAAASEVPVVVMCYANMVFATGADRFADRLSAAGVAGAIVPDLPLEEGEGIRAALDDAGLALVPLVAPTTPPERRRAICAAARGFVYLVSDVGTTGERHELPAGLAGLVESTRSESELPVAVGFGIGSPEQVAAVGQVADGVIVGSRLVRAVAESDGAAQAADAVGSFLREARAALSR